MKNAMSVEQDRTEVSGCHKAWLSLETQSHGAVEMNDFSHF
jgi:hypothetical protein